MTICEPFYEGLDRRLKEKMTINQIAYEMCRGVKGPRRKVIRILKEYKGEEYLVNNADWLGYSAGKGHDNINLDDAQNCVTDSLPISGEQKVGEIVADETDTDDTELEISNNPIVRLIKEREKEAKEINEKNGLFLCGYLNDDNEFSSIRYFCYVEPALIRNFYHVEIQIYLNFAEDRKEEVDKQENEEEIDYDVDNDDNVKLIFIHTKCPVPAELVGMAVDVLLYPDWWHKKVEKFLSGKIDTFPDIPNIGKSNNPNWEWTCYIKERLKNPYFLSIGKEFDKLRRLEV